MQAGDIPTYPEGRDLQITDFHHIVPLLKEHPLKISDYNFTNIFAWRIANKYKVSLLDNMIITFGKFRDDGPFFFPPIGDPKRAADTVHKIFEFHKDSNNRPFLAFASKHLAQELDKNPLIKIVPDRNNWDYVYKSSDLAELPGQKYHAKRNLIKQFETTYSATVEELTTSTCLEAIEYSDRWCEQRDCDSDEGLERERCAIYQMLSHFEALRLNGILVRINGEIHGLTMGERLNPDTYVIHVEKGDQHVKGIYQFLNREISLAVAHKYPWINREEDLGINGLRRAKTSYHPDHFIEKYKVTHLNSKD
jgi:hypothetical protein